LLPSKLYKQIAISRFNLYKNTELIIYIIYKSNNTICSKHNNYYYPCIILSIICSLPRDKYMHNAHCISV